MFLNCARKLMGILRSCPVCLHLCPDLLVGAWIRAGQLHRQSQLFQRFEVSIRGSGLTGDLLQ